MHTRATFVLAPVSFSVTLLSAELQPTNAAVMSCFHELIVYDLLISLNRISTTCMRFPLVYRLPLALKSPYSVSETGRATVDKRGGAY